MKEEKLSSKQYIRLGDQHGEERVNAEDMYNKEIICKYRLNFIKKPDTKTEGEKYQQCIVNALTHSTDYISWPMQQEPTALAVQLPPCKKWREICYVNQHVEVLKNRYMGMGIDLRKLLGKHWNLGQNFLLTYIDTSRY